MNQDCVSLCIFCVDVCVCIPPSLFALLHWAFLYTQEEYGVCYGQGSGTIINQSLFASLRSCKRYIHSLFFLSIHVLSECSCLFHILIWVSNAMFGLATMADLFGAGSGCSVVVFFAWLFRNTAWSSFDTFKRHRLPRMSSLLQLHVAWFRLLAFRQLYRIDWQM